MNRVKTKNNIVEMKLNQHLKDWKQLLSSRFSTLSLPQVNGLATWRTSHVSEETSESVSLTFGMVMTRSSSVSKISTLIAKINAEQENTARQRLKEWYKSGEAKSKPGNKRASLQVSQCYGSLLQWIIDLLPQKNKELPIAIDATNIGQNFTVLSINILYRSCAIPVAWKVVKGTSKGSWKPYWQQLFQSLRDIVPQDYLVIVSADRGLYADWLYQEIVALGWHPFLRINHQGQYRIWGSTSWKALATVVNPKTKNWSGQITCFKGNSIECTLLARWDDGYTDPWLILTDLKPDDANVGWAARGSVQVASSDALGDSALRFRSWIECSYRDVKSDGFGWHKTRLRQPDRAERHWLAMSVAMLWMVTLGGEQEIASDEPLIGDREASQRHRTSSFSPSSNINHSLSCFINGLLTVIAQLLNGQSLSFGRLFPLPLNHFSNLAFSNSS